MAMILKQDIDAATTRRLEQERTNPGCFWEDGRLTRAEAEVFAIAYADYPRMASVYDAWLEFIGLVVDGAHSREALAEARALFPELSDAGNEPHPFAKFAMAIGGLTNRQAEAIYWKEWFWIVREGHATYGDEFMEAREHKGARH